MLTAMTALGLCGMGTGLQPELEQSRSADTHLSTGRSSGHLSNLSLAWDLVQAHQAQLTAKQVGVPSTAGCLQVWV